jgi:hypothetical protein
MAERTWVLLRRLRVPRVRRRHEGHHYAQPAAHLWSTAALCVSLALTFPVMMRPIHGIVEARLLAPGGWLRSKLAPSQWRRRRRPRSRGAVGSSRPSSGARSARRSPSCCPRSSTSASWHPCKRSRWTVVRGRFELMIDQFSCCRLVLLYKFRLHDISPHSFCFRAQKYV